MIPFYEEKKECISIVHKRSRHFPPHIHEAMECVYVTSGTLELGVGTELFHMEKGDFAIVFPNIIHHYQVFDSGENRAIYIFLDPSLSSVFYEDLQKLSPEYPIIEKDKVHADVHNAVMELAGNKKCTPMLIQAYMQIILAHVFSEMHMVDKGDIGGNDIIYHTVEYVAKNFKEEMSLEKMARDLGISKYVLSRLFAKTFHCNYNQYVNRVRLDYAVLLIENTNSSITTICMESGFESQRTFNRVFKERYKMTPREYRNQTRERKIMSA